MNNLGVKLIVSGTCVLLAAIAIPCAVPIMEPIGKKIAAKIKARIDCNNYWKGFKIRVIFINGEPY
jgi:hypothetical protein